jgi:hypothetical protein
MKSVPSLCCLTKTEQTLTALSKNDGISMLSLSRHFNDVNLQPPGIERRFLLLR